MVIKCRECGAWQRRARRRTFRIIHATVWGLSFGAGLAMLILAMR